MMEIYGNEGIIAQMGEMVRKGREPHSVIIYGEKGLGKKAVAKYFAAQLMCEEKSGTPCGRCRACRMLENGTHPDFIMARPNDKGNYIVKEIRDMILGDIAVAPNEGDIKVFVIPDLDVSTVTMVQIQNILLKVIEEPPDYAALILTARNKESFLPTIISRCISFGVVNVTEQQSADYLQKRFNDKSYDEIRQAVFAGRGSIGRCEEYLNEGPFFAASQLAGRLAQAYATGSEYEVLKSLAGAEGKKRLLRDGLYYFSEIVRDALLLQARGKDEGQLISCDINAAAKLANSLSMQQGARVYDTLCSFIRKVDSNCSLSLTANALCASLF